MIFMDKIVIKGLKIFAYHGVFEEERERGQNFILDLVMSVDLDAASREDDLEKTVSYADVTETVIRVFTAEKYKLIERAAGAVADAVLTEYKKIKSVTVTLKKPDAPVKADFDYMAVEITRQSEDA